MKLDLHNHTWYSPDSITSPKRFIGRSKEKGVVLAVTEHNNGNSWRFLERESKQQEWLFIKGQEQKTYWGNSLAGELIGLFLQEPLKKTEVMDVVDEIHDQDGLVMVPHPFDNRSVLNSRKFQRLDDIVDAVDLIEVFNARIRSQSRNAAALEYALSHQKAFSVGSDAHLPWEISNCHLSLACDDLEECRKLLLKNQGLQSVHTTNPVNLYATLVFKFPVLRKWFTRKKE